MQESENITLREFVKAAAKWINRHFFIKTIITVIPIIMGIIVSTPLFRFAVTDDGKLNIKGKCVLGLTFLIIGIVEGVTNYVARNDDDNSRSYRSEIRIREKISETEINFSDDKNTLLRSGYRSIAHNHDSFRDFVHHYVKPVQRTNDILKQISFCIEHICDVSQQNIIHSAIIRIDNEEWKWLCTTQTPGTADIIEIVGKNSAIDACLSEGGYYYCNDKKEAIRIKKYISDPRDIRESNIGSIICWEVKTDLRDESDTNHKISVIISFSTYGKQLMKQESSQEDIKRIYENVILKMVLIQYKSQLCENIIWYAMQHL